MVQIAATPPITGPDQYAAAGTVPPDSPASVVTQLMLHIFRQADSLCEHKLPGALVMHFDGGPGAICWAILKVGRVKTVT